MSAARMRLALLLAFGLLLPVGAEVAGAQTQRGYLGDTLTVRRTAPSAGCYREVLLGGTGTFLARDTLCWVARPVVVPPPIVVQPPAGSDEPVDPGTYLWADNFDRYDLALMGNCAAEATYGRRTQYNSANCANPPAAKYQLTTGRNGTGHALRSVYDGGTVSQSLAWLSPWGGPYGREIVFGPKVVIQFWTRIGVGQTFLPNGTKFFEVWWTSGPTGRIQWGHEAKFSMGLGANPGNTVNRTTQPLCPCWANINDGQWHRVTLLFKANTSSSYRNVSGITSATETYTGTSSRDGRAAMWIDGKKIMDYSQATVGVTPAGGTGVWATQGDVDMLPVVTVHHLQFPEVTNGTAGGVTMDHDDLKVWPVP